MNLNAIATAPIRKRKHELPVSVRGLKHVPKPAVAAFGDRQRCGKSDSNPSAAHRHQRSKSTVKAHIAPLAQISELPGAALIGDFDDLYQTHHRRVYRQCLRMVRNPEDAEDLTQEVFLQLFRKVHTFRGDSNFSTWLHRLTVNTVLMSLRRVRRAGVLLTSLDSTPGAEETVSDMVNTLNALPSPATHQLTRIGLQVALARLSSGYKDIFLLHDVEGYRHEEIAKLLGISEGTSKSQLHKARLRLRFYLQSGRRAGFRKFSLSGRERTSFYAVSPYPAAV